MIREDIPSGRDRSAAAAAASHAAYEPAVFTDDGIREWAEVQERYAKAIPATNPRHGSAVLIRAYVENILARLACAAPALLQKRLERRHREILRQLRVEWHERKPTVEPPLALLETNARRQAYCEAREDVMMFVQRIIAIRRGVASPNDGRRIHYRPVKRVR